MDLKENVVSSCFNDTNICKEVSLISLDKEQDNLPDSTVEDFSKYKRRDVLTWDEMFMGMAFLASKRSKDPVSQVGACIVDVDNIIVGIGYNGMPNGCDDNDFPWCKVGSPINTKYMYVCHAEMNAILNTSKSRLNNCRIYVGMFPCNECAKIIIQSGMKLVIYMSTKNVDSESCRASIKMFNAAGVTYKKFIPKCDKLTIDFNSLNK